MALRGLMRSVGGRGVAAVLFVLLPCCSFLVSTSDLVGGPRGRAPESGDAALPDNAPFLDETNQGDSDAAVALNDADSALSDASLCDANLATSFTNCGACGVTCSAEMVCSAGKCALPKACSELFAAQPRPASGFFTLVPNPATTGDTFKAYCELDSNQDGGGWTLLMKIDGTKDTFGYGSALWTNPASLNADSTELNDITGEAKLAGFSTMPVVSAVRLGFVDAGTTRWKVIPTTGSSLLAIFSGPPKTATATTASRDAWRKLLASSSTQASCNLEGFNVANTGNYGKARLGILFNESNDCGSTDSYIGVGLNTSLRGSSPPVSPSAGNTADYNVGEDNGYKNTFVFAYVMIR